MYRLTPIAVLLVLCLSAEADPKTEIRPLMKKGLKYTRNTEITGEGTINFKVGDTGMSIPMKMGFQAQTKLAEEILEAKDGSPTALRRVYHKRSSLNRSMDMEGQKPEESPLTGRVLTLETKNGKIERSMAGGTADADLLAAEELVDPMTAALSSGKPVAIGESWSADKVRAKVWLQSIFNGKEPQEAELACKLVELTQAFGQKCARVHLDAHMKVEMHFVGHPEAILEVAFEGDAVFGLTSGTALAMDAKGRIKGELEQRTQNGNEGMIPLEIPLELTAKAKLGEADFK